MCPERNNAQEDLCLSPRHIDVWCTRLDLDQTVIAHCYTLLSTDERARVHRFKPEQKKREYIITRGLLRKVLGRALQGDPASLQFAYAEHGKPALILQASHPAISFNVTHSHNQALIALSLGHLVGIDIELIRDDVDFKGLAKRFFSAAESTQLLRYRQSSLPAAFFACWTRKEAFVKALGDGIGYGLSEFSVSVDPEETTVSLTIHRKTAPSVAWQIHSFQPADRYIGAVAVAGGDVTLRYRDDGLQVF